MRASDAPRTPGSPATAAPQAASWPSRGRGAEPVDRAEAGAVGGRGRDVRAGAQAVQVERGVVPAHAVEQLGQFGRGAGGDEEVGAAVRGGGHGAHREPHAFEPDQGAAAGRLGDLDDVEGAAHGKHHRGAGELAPGLRHFVEGGTGRDDGGEVQGVCARRWAVGPAARAGPGGGPGAGRHVPAPQPGELGHGRALRGAAAATRAGPDFADAADREAHAPSNGSSTQVVT